MTSTPAQRMVVRKLAARTAVAASKTSGRSVAPRVQALADLPIVPGDGAARGRYSLAVRRAAASVAVAASKKSGRPVDPRVRALAEWRRR